MSKIVFIFMLLFALAQGNERSWDKLENVALVCVYREEVEQKPRQLKKVIRSATVVTVGKGSLKVGEKIAFTFYTDDLKNRPRLLPGDLIYVGFDSNQRNGKQVNLQTGDMNSFSKRSTQLFESIGNPAKK